MERGQSGWMSGWTNEWMNERASEWLNEERRRKSEQRRKGMAKWQPLWNVTHSNTHAFAYAHRHTCPCMPPIRTVSPHEHKRDRNGEINKKAISDYILQHLFFPKIDLGYLMLPLNNILTFIHKVSLLNYWGRKRDLDFLLFGCFTCVPYADMHSITRYAPGLFSPRSSSLFLLSVSLFRSLARSRFSFSLSARLHPSYTLSATILCSLPLHEWEHSFHIWCSMCRLNVAWHLCTRA